MQTRRCGSQALTPAPQWASVGSGDCKERAEVHMTARAAFILVALGGLGLGLAAESAASAQAAGADRGATRSQLDAWAQTRPKSARARTRIRVYPVYPYRLETLPYPPPYDYEYPGPGAVRQCTARLVQEHRPSGTVIVPAMRCWWERG